LIDLPEEEKKATSQIGQAKNDRTRNKRQQLKKRTMQFYFKKRKI